MRFHIAHVVPNPRLHGLYGYQEVIDTLQWGLREIGHEVTAGKNAIESDRINIIFGVQMIAQHATHTLPDNTIIYNLEQVAGVSLAALKASFATVAKRFQIWDYSEKNLSAWRDAGASREPLHVPIGWAPILKRIPQAPEEIDVLFYGIPSTGRMRIISELCAAGVKVVYACGLYGAARDALIARSKIVLNINQYADTRIFEVVRVSYLLANGKAVVSDIAPNSFVEPDMPAAVLFTPLEHIVQTCIQLLADEPRRRELERLGPEIMQKRDIRTPLKRALAAMGLESGG